MACSSRPCRRGVCAVPRNNRRDLPAGRDPRGQAVAGPPKPSAGGGKDEGCRLLPHVARRCRGAANNSGAVLFHRYKREKKNKANDRLRRFSIIIILANTDPSP